MTGGVAVILGPVGPNFAAGMSGGMAFIYDVDDRLPERIHPDSVIHQRIETEHWETLLRDLLSEHWRETLSGFAHQIGSAHVGPPVPNSDHVCRLLIVKNHDINLLVFYETIL